MDGLKHEIIDVAVFAFRLPFKGTLHLKKTALTFRDGLLLRLTGANGKEGWGEIAPLPGFSQETLAEARNQACWLAPLLRGIEIPMKWPAVGEDLSDLLKKNSLVASVRCGLETALWDLSASSRRLQLHLAWSATAREVVPLNGLILGGIEDLVAESKSLVDAGFTSIKLKVGNGTVDEDITRVKALVSMLPEQVSLRLDANRRWSYPDALAFAAGVQGRAIEYIEEPLEDPEQLPNFAKESRIPVALDESLVGLQPEKLSQFDYASAIVLKPMLLGGPLNSMQLADFAMDLNIKPVLSSSFESGIGTRTNVALAANMGNQAIPTGLAVYKYFLKDVFTPRLDFSLPRLKVERMLRPKRRMDMSYLRRVMI